MLSYGFVKNSRDSGCVHVVYVYGFYPYIVEVVSLDRYGNHKKVAEFQMDYLPTIECSGRGKGNGEAHDEFLVTSVNTVKTIMFLPRNSGTIPTTSNGK